MTNIFKGLITAVITPMKDGKIDFAAFKALVKTQMEAAVDGIVVAGSTGEGNCFTNDEVASLLYCAKETLGADGNTKLIAGIANVSTKEALDKVSNAESVGVDGLMITAPHYIKPNQAGLIAHFKATHEASSVPIMLYAHPFRTGVDLADETITELAALERIVALKDAGADLARPLRLRKKIPGFNVLTGNDENYLCFAANGAVGLVSVLSNLMPKTMKKMVAAALDGDRELALEIQQKLFDIYDAIYSDTNPIGVKCAAMLLGMVHEEYNLPLVPASASVKEKIREVVPLIKEMEGIS